MNNHRQRPLAVGNLRAFEAVARLLSFSEAAEELHLTQSAVSRQIKSLEEEIGATLFLRGTRHVDLTGDGLLLHRALVPALERLDAGVRQIRHARGRKVVSVTTFASFASLWLIPRLEIYQRAHPDVDIRVSASDSVIELDDSDVDLALRYRTPDRMPPNAQRLFGEMVTPAISPWLLQQIERGEAPRLDTPADLARHALSEEDDYRLVSSDYLSWRHWFAAHGLSTLQPRSWIYFNYTYQQIQAALAGQVVTLARLALVAESLARGELIEPFGAEMRVRSPWAYWLVRASNADSRPEVQEFADWVLAQAEQTRQQIGEASP